MSGSAKSQQPNRNASNLIQGGFTFVSKEGEELVLPAAKMNDE